jgi:hypothetical protein
MLEPRIRTMNMTTRTGPMATLGTPYKLISPRGTLLGVLTVPDEIAHELGRRDYVRFALMPPFDVRAYFDNTPPAACAEATIARCHHLEFGRDGVQVFGVSIEDLEKRPGWSFAPSAGYLRSLMAD